MTNTTPQTSPKQSSPSTRPNEIGGFYFSSGIKIVDPNTNEVFLQKRGD